ncbi:MAG: hypothetical protein HLUCCA08_16475 [Rhodobacteraceae bacterium HLUCCA08]|nr:MAG: hypothetical protein HLUCCA08_16475 [Rhodobacteraceae bacterium HLUCCA08]
MDRAELNGMIDEVRRLLDERLRVRGRSLSRQLRRAGRMLPRRLRRDARALVEAQSLTGHPTLGLMLDRTRLGAAHRRLVEHLEAIDPVEARKTRVIRLAATIALNLLIVAGLLVAVLVWRGFL